MADTELNTNRKLRAEIERLRTIVDRMQQEAADNRGAVYWKAEVENLRQRVKELENGIEAATDIINSHASELAELRKAQGEPFAWATFDGEGGYDLRLYANNENYRVDYIIRNGQKYADWVYPLYTSAPSKCVVSTTVPEGWQLVPKEPTKEMYDAASHLVTGDWKGRGFEYPDELYEAYTAMLAAAPKPK